jgi:proteasome assembly chaperone (PAC2) family protein
MKDPFRFSSYPKFEKPSLIVGWNNDTGMIAQKVIHFLNEQLRGQQFCKIEPVGFFSFAGIAVEDDIAQFPESNFFSTERKDLLIYISDQPNYEQYRFLSVILDIAEEYCKIQEIYTISGMVSLSVHTAPRRIFTVFNQPEIRESLQGYGLEEMTWEGPPAISSYLLWIAQRRGIPGMSLWLEIPFYLAANEDPLAIKLILSFLDKRFNLGLNLEKFDGEIREQNEKIEWLRKGDAEIDQYLNLLESGVQLDEESQLKLVKQIYEVLKK